MIHISKAGLQYYYAQYRDLVFNVELLVVSHTQQTRANQPQQEFSQTFLEVCESSTISLDIHTDELATKIANIGIRFSEIYPNNATAMVTLNAKKKNLNLK